MGSKKTSTAIKICGITKATQAKAIASLGVDAIGVIGVEKSPRFVSEEKRRNIFNCIENFSSTLQRVWVIADMDRSQIRKALEGDGTPSVIQLHGYESPKLCEDLRREYPNIQWWKAIQIRTSLDISKTHNYEGAADALLLDAWSQTALGGTGNRLPLNLIQELKFQIPWWLAGGISAEWIPEILCQVNPFGIDASSRLEKSPGVKDLELVNNLVLAVKGMDERFSQDRN